MPNNVIYKYTLHITDLCDYDLPEGAEILSVAEQRGRLCMWALLNPNAPKKTRHIEIIGTGNPIVNDMGIDRKFIGTAIVEPFVWHVFERFGV